MPGALGIEQHKGAGHILRYLYAHSLFKSMLKHVPCIKGVCLKKHSSLMEGGKNVILFSRHCPFKESENLVEIGLSISLILHKSLF